MYSNHNDESLPFVLPQVDGNISMLSYEDSEYDLSDGGNQRSSRIGEGINVGDESFHVSQSRSVRVSTTLPVISLFNMRSIWAKLESKVDDFEERSVSISIVNELWIDEDNFEHENEMERIHQMKRVTFINNTRREEEEFPF